MKLHSYVIDHDLGFAPNPFYGACTLAACKPRIRQHASVDDYIVGTGCAKRKRSGYLIYFMRVQEILSFDAYWNDPRFTMKRPNFCGSKMQAYGDNIYHMDAHNGLWIQEKSFHSYPNGKTNQRNFSNDTSSTRVLISRDFAYWGGCGPVIPGCFRDHGGIDICCLRQGHKNRFPDELVTTFVGWLRSLEAKGFQGKPLDWSKGRPATRRASRDRPLAAVHE